MRRGGQQQIDRSAFVGFDVAERYPAQLLDRDDACYCLRDQGKQLPQPGVEQERLLARDQELVERETLGTDVGNPGRQPKDSVRDFVDVSVHCLIMRDTALHGGIPLVSGAGRVRAISPSASAAAALPSISVTVQPVMVRSF